MAGHTRNGSRIWICLLWAVLLIVLAGGVDFRIQQADAHTTAETGLKARYYDSKSLSKLRLTRTDPAVDFSWGNGSPARSVASDTFSARWTGLVEPETSGTYTFHTQTSDGVRLWVDGKLLVDRWRTQSKREWSGTIPLNADQHYSIKMEYFEGTGSATARLLWSGPSVAKQVVPEGRLFPPAAQAGPVLTVDAAASRHPINPDIYGMNFADEALAEELRLPVRRWGGNATTRYNWRTDTANRASDWYFENIPNDNPDPDALPDGSTSDRFVEQDLRTGTKTLLTVPLIGWTPAGRAYACGFSVKKYGAQQDTDPWRTDCGNGVRPDGTEITGNAPSDTSTQIEPAFVQDWVRHLIQNYGTASQGGVSLYNLDNEPMLWNSTHRDVHPQPTSYDELRDRTYRYAAAIKAVDRDAKTLGPAEWGWTGYFYSAKDAAPGGAWWNDPRDRNAHGGTPLVEWYLQQMRAYEQQHDVRILDYLDLHNYPQAPGVALSPAGDAQNQAQRLRSTRSLWDPTYADESWIDEPVRLIPRMHDWVEHNYPGTKLAITEYNWGALDHMNGALAQADILGIFGREELDLATLWSPPEASEPGAYAFRMYRNYDGRGGAYGDTWVRSASADQGRLALYAAQRSSDGHLTIMVINKTKEALTSDLNLSGFSPGGSAQVYRYSATNPNQIVRGSDQAVPESGFTATYPAESITLVVVPAN